MYDNAQSNAVMQRAIIILNIWEGLSANQKQKFFNFIDETCSPLEEYYDDDLTHSDEDDLKKVTFQIKVSHFVQCTADYSHHKHLSLIRHYVCVFFIYTE